MRRFFGISRIFQTCQSKWAINQAELIDLMPIYIVADK